VLSGSRYSTITNEVKSLLKGEYGATPAPVNKDLQQQAIGESAVITCRPADLLNEDFQSSAEDFKTAIAEKAILAEASDENILIYVMFPEIGLNYLQNADNLDYFEPEPLEINQLNDVSYLVTVDDHEYSVTLKADNSVTINDGSPTKEVLVSPAAQAGTGTVIEAPLGGNIFRLIATEGESVGMDSTVLILEAMKMETEIKAPAAGVIGKIFVQPGDTVKPGNPLFEIIN
jgi:oxaloacetate decarboxylase alpha subunit